MDPERYLRIQVSVAPQHQDLFVALCWELGTIGVTEVEAPDRIDVYFESNDEDGARAETLRRRVAEQRLRVGFLDEAVIRSRSDEWLAGFRERFSSFRVGRRLWIHPPWESRSHEGVIGICIEPGAAFGTGTHESTRLCLEAMEEMAPPRSVLDVGTGSGILTVAALKLWPDVRAVAIDNDPRAAAVARATFMTNQLGGLFLAAAPPRAIRSPVDLVVANLTRSILENEAAELVRLCRRELLVSGFTEEEEDAVSAVFCKAGRWARVFERRLRGWSSLRMERLRQD